MIKWKHFPRYWPFVREIHRSPVNSSHKGQWCGAFDVFFDLRLNKWLSKQCQGWWFETPSRTSWVQNAPNWASRSHIPHTHESSCNQHVKQYLCETSERYLSKWPKSRILTYFGVQNGPKIWPLGPIFYITESSSNEHIRHEEIF